MNSIERFRKGALLTATQMNGLVDSLNSLVGVRASLNHAPRGYHQAAENGPPVEPAGGLYDRRRGLDAQGVSGLPSDTATVSAWLGYAPGVETAQGRVASAARDCGQVFTMCAQCGGTLWQKVTTDSAGGCVQTCVVYRQAGCEVGCGHLWNVRWGECGVLWRKLARVERNPLTAACCLFSDADMLVVKREHDFTLPVLTQGAKIVPRGCHTGYMSLVDTSNPQTTVVYNLALHAPEFDFSLKYDENSVIVWQHQVQPDVVGGHVYAGPGEVNGQVNASARVWTAHKPAVASPCAWTPGALNVCAAETSGGDMCDFTLWMRVCTDRFGSVCSSCLVRCGDVQESPPGEQRLWDPVSCAAGQLWHRVGVVKNGRAVTMHDFRLPILTQNALVQDDWLQNKAVKLMQDPDNSTPNRYVKRLRSCACGLRFCDRGCVIVLVDC